MPNTLILGRPVRRREHWFSYLAGLELSTAYTKTLSGVSGAAQPGPPPRWKPLYAHLGLTQLRLH